MKTIPQQAEFACPCGCRQAFSIEVGFWLGRYRTGRRQWGPLLPAAIMRVHTLSEPGVTDNAMERSPFWGAFIAGEPVDVWTIHNTTHTDPQRIFRRERDIDEPEYRFRVSDQAWTREFAPDEPQARPHTTIDLMQCKLPF